MSVLLLLFSVGKTCFMGGTAWRLFFFGAGSGGRTRTVSLPLDFESSTSANSIIPAYLVDLAIVSHLGRKIKGF